MELKSGLGQPSSKSVRVAFLQQLLHGGAYLHSLSSSPSASLLEIPPRFPINLE